MAFFVLLGTSTFNSFESIVGWANVPVLATASAIAATGRSCKLQTADRQPSLRRCFGWARVACHLFTPAAASLVMLCGADAIFFYLTSFMHYAVYIATYHQRAGVAFGAFKRDALLYKTLALSQAAFQYLALFDYAHPDALSLSMVLSGFGLATLAAHRLGVDRTYFGWELGEVRSPQAHATGRAPLTPSSTLQVTGQCVTRFPYGSIPHPMILGGCVGWLGFFKLAGFRAAWPLYAPLHVCCYMLHAAQEHFAIHANGKLYSEKVQ